MNLSINETISPICITSYLQKKEKTVATKRERFKMLNTLTHVSIVISSTCSLPRNTLILGSIIYQVFVAILTLAKSLNIFRFNFLHLFNEGIRPFLKFFSALTFYSSQVRKKWFNFWPCLILASFRKLIDKN